MLIQNYLSTSKSFLHLRALNYVPKYNHWKKQDLKDLQLFLETCDKLLVLTGAGISTESGIPDYRSEGVGLYATSKTRPVKFHDFMTHEHIRRRYWTRNYSGWPNFSSVQPNPSHLTLGKWEKNSDRLQLVVTQNVDRLHAKAGSERLIELHGTAFRVICMKCGELTDRDDLQRTLESINGPVNSQSLSIRPDGDVEASQIDPEKFHVPECRKCGGILKPDIVFFGENVPRERVDLVFENLKRADKLLVVGSSLEVYSGYRFLVSAQEQNKPVAILNIGPTRGDHIANLKLNARCSDILTRIDFS